ncbi:MAG: PLP-dependent aminotransferase family protein [Roseovarius sp.]|nr:PLP-dependent aminotransferase family protein [Roseovarius sp.]
MLRQAIADHIGPARGIPADPEDIVIVGGSQDGLTLIAQAFGHHCNTFLHEDPCYQGARFAFHGTGWTCTPVPVDAQGIEVERLPERGPSLLYVTPSHQYPIGMTMTLERRLALLDWAERTDSLIIEDDYDGEFRYEGAPLTALRGLDRTGRVIYLGTFSKSIGPGLRLGFVIASPGGGGAAEALEAAQQQLRALAGTGGDGRVHGLRRFPAAPAAHPGALHEPP